MRAWRQRFRSRQRSPVSGWASRRRTGVGLPAGHSIGVPIGAAIAVERAASIIEAIPPITAAATLTERDDVGLAGAHGWIGKRCVEGARGGKDQVQA